MTHDSGARRRKASGKKTAYSPELSTGLERIEKDLIRINRSTELFCRRLGDVLPDISLEIYKTDQKASETMDSLASADPPGLIAITLNHLERCLNAVHAQISENRGSDALLLRRVRDLAAHLSAVPPCFLRMRDMIEGLDIPCRPTQGDERHPDSTRHITELARFSAQMIATLEDIIDRNPPMTACLQQMESLETQIIQAVERHTRDDISDLQATLDVIISILKDLSGRSNATRHPIQTIMTSLQVHDIVRQDLENILVALTTIRQGTVASAQTPLFLGQACLAAAALLDEISAAVHNQARLIDTGIATIQSVVSGVKTDKVHLAEVLLHNHTGDSTIDAAMAEVKSVMHGQASHLGEVVAETHRALGFVTALRENLHTLDTVSLAAIETALKLANSVPAQGSAPIKALKSDVEAVRVEVTGLKHLLPQEWFHKTHDVEQLTDLIIQIDKGTADAQGNLDEIKQLLIDSIDGINDYAKRCMLAIKRFRHRMERLHRHLDRIADIAGELRGFAALAGAMGTAPDTVPGADLEDPRLIEILAALARPHIATLAEPPDRDEGPDDGLTLF